MKYLYVVCAAKIIAIYGVAIIAGKNFGACKIKPLMVAAMAQQLLVQPAAHINLVQLCFLHILMDRCIPVV